MEKKKRQRREIRVVYVCLENWPGWGQQHGLRNRVTPTGYKKKSRRCMITPPGCYVCAECLSLVQRRFFLIGSPLWEDTFPRSWLGLFIKRHVLKYSILIPFVGTRPLVYSSVSSLSFSCSELVGNGRQVGWSRLLALVGWRICLLLWRFERWISLAVL